MGRERDPFDRTMTALRERLAVLGPLQGAALPVNGLALELGVSQTPVREALSRLAGEGLVERTTAGYRAAMHDPVSLAGLYRLAAVLAQAILHEGVALTEGSGLAPPELLLASAPASAMREAYQRATARLQALRAGEARVFGDVDAEARRIGVAMPLVGPERARLYRRYYVRRTTRSAAILAAALGLVQPRII